MATDDWIGKKVSISFLRDYHEFGSRGHFLTVNALKTAMLAADDLDDKKVLAIKAYEEFVSALEDLGAICIAVRHRDDAPGLIYAFLSYETRTKFAPKTSLNQVFTFCQNGDGLTSGLRLPTLSEVLAGAPSLKDSILPTFYNEVNVFLAKAAFAYLQLDGALIRAYNKMKHGFIVIKDRHALQAEPPLYSPNTAWIVAKNSSYNPANSGSTNVVELFAVKTDNVDAIVDQVTTIRGTTMTICELTAILLEHGVITSADSE